MDGRLYRLTGVPGRYHADGTIMSLILMTHPTDGVLQRLIYVCQRRHQKRNSSTITITYTEFRNIMSEEKTGGRKTVNEDVSAQRNPVSPVDPT